MKNYMLLGQAAATILLLAAQAVQAQYGGGGGASDVEAAAGPAALNTVDTSVSPLIDGSYASLLGQYRITQDNDPELDQGWAGGALLGYRNNGYGLEAGFGYGEEKGITQATFISNVLLYPFDSLPMFYGLVGVGATRYAKYPVVRPQNAIAGGDDFVTVNAQTGLGYMIPLQWGGYEYALRLEGVYRYADRFLERDSESKRDISAPGQFKDVLINVGLQLPLRRPAPPPPPPEPVQVVEPTKVCADTTDNDGDGKIDMDDPGCTSPDDDSEIDPPQCSDGKDNDGDGSIDFPADKGCTGADDNDEVDPCKTPAPGERISLKGCGTGDVIVLRGVNFDFDKSTLTVNAKTILDGVSEELVAYPEIKIELGGHTDAKGSDEYNQSLSERRATSVVSYLEGKGVAADRMTSAGYGESQPVADNETDEGRELNRRVELKITAGVAADGSPTAAEVAPAADAPAEPTPAAPADEMSAEELPPLEAVSVAP